MTLFSRSPCFAAFLSLSLGSGFMACKTAEFRSLPEERKLSPKTEIVTEKKPDPVPQRVSAADPIQEAALNPVITDSVIVPRDVTETFTQDSTKNTADILIVIDDSNSMRGEQKNLSTKMNALIKSLDKTNWQIGVITTSAMKVGDEYECRLNLIHSTDPDTETKFRNAIQAGILGDANEQGILQAVVGLRCPEKPWVREKSTLAVLIVSDEDNCSNGMGCKNSPAQSERFLIDYVEKDLGRMVGINAGFFGIYSPPGEECKDAAAAAHIYKRLIEYRAANQKNYGKICDENYQSTLERISSRIADLLKATFDLKEAPILGTIKVEGKKANGDAISPSDFTVMGKVLGFIVGSEPMKGSTLKVSYQVPGTL